MAGLSAKACALVLALAAACGSGGGRSGGRDAAPADPYQLALAPLARLESEAIGAVAAHMGERYTDDEALVKALRETAIPRYREFVTALERLSPPPGPRGGLHARLVVLAHAELDALERLADGVEKGDGNAVLEVNREQRRLADEIDGLLRSWTQAGQVAAQAASTSSSDANSGSK